ncbi:MAG: phosphoglycolate phosphatase [Pseudomonadales bacterium]|jgi:phosphoglycolate phosphatase|nr:phosphoglycolate phosphatase [Cellvibrionales bacterium]MBP8030700.1 phosphoglycolate phosphatase [Pseudomonadales bacterium]
MKNSFSLDNYDLLLFDLDGTLVDSAPDIAAAVDATLHAQGWPAAGVERVRSWVGNGSRKLIERALVFAVQDFDTSLHETIHSQFLLEYAKHNGPETRVFDGVYECLDYCLAAGKKMACVTNKPEHLAKQLVTHLAMDKYFSIVIGGDTFPQRKPDPTALLYCCKTLGVPNARTLMIGDSETDVSSARAANMEVLCVSYGYNHGGSIANSHPDYLTHNLMAALDKP